VTEDYSGNEYPSIEGIILDVFQILGVSGELDSWYSYRKSESGDIVVESYDENGEVDKTYIMSFSVEEAK